VKNFYEKIPHPKKDKYSKSLKVLKYLNEKNEECDVDFDLFAAQSHHISDSFDLLFNLLKNQKKKITIIELGTFKGGLTVILDAFARSYKLDYELHSFDITTKCISSQTMDLFNQLGVNFHLGNIFSENLDVISSLIQDPDSVAVVLCDGGRKDKEINYFSTKLKVGDIIMGHDYGFNRDEFLTKEWNACELTYSGIAGACSENNIKFLFKNPMEKSVWFCGRKTNPVGATTQILTVCNEPYVKIMIHLIRSLATYHPEIPVKMLALNLTDESKQVLLDEHSNLIFIDDDYRNFKNFEEERAYCESCRTWNIKELLHKTCSDVFYLDGDVYLEDSLYELFDFFEAVDFCARIKVESPLRFNAGMIYVKNTPKNIAIVHEWEVETRKHGWVWLSAQNELGNVLEQHKKVVTVKTFPTKFDGIDTNPETVLVHMKGPRKRKR